MTMETLIGVTCLAIGGIGVAAELRQLRLAVASTTWPQVPGEIEAVSVVPDVELRAHPLMPVVRYRYRVGANQYVSDVLGFGGTVSSSFRGVAEATLKRYRDRKDVTVRVSPADPATCCLEPGVPWHLWLGLLMTIGVAGFGIALVIKGL